MAVTYDNASSTSGSGVTSLTWSHTCTGSNLGLIVGVSFYPGNVESVTGVTYNGVAMTTIGSVLSVDQRAHQWRLINPATGAHNVVVTFSDAVDAVAGAVSATGVHQTTMIGTQATASGTAVEPTVDVTSATDELVVDCLCWWENGAGAPTVGADQTQRWEIHSTANADGAGSTQVGAATSTMSWTTPNAETWALAAVAFKPSASLAPIPIFAYNIINS